MGYLEKGVKLCIWRKTVGVVTVGIPSSYCRMPWMLEPLLENEVLIQAID